MYEVFISYSTEDKAVADALCHRFEAGGIRCWYAPRDVAPGSIWQESLMEAIQKAKVFLLIYSKDYNNSMQVLNELTAAVNAGCFIVPFRIDQSNMNNAFAYYLNSVHWLDAVNPPTEQQIEDLYGHICNVLQKAPPPPPPEPPEEPADPENAENTENTENAENTGGKKRSKKKRKKWMWLFVLIPVLLLLAISLWPDSSPQQIKFLNLSQLENYYYPFYSIGMLSDELEMYCVENKEDGTLTIARTDNGRPYLTGIENVFDNPLNTFLRMRDGRDTIYFLEYQSATELVLRLYSKSAREWLDKDGIEINILPEEYILTTSYNTQTMLSTEDHSEEIGIYIYNGSPNINCLSKIIRAFPDGHIEELDIRQYGLQKALSGIDDPSHSYSLFLGSNHTLNIFDLETGKVLNLTHQEILERFIPLTQEDLPWFSPDKRYLYTNDSDTAYVWDLSTGKLAFQRTFTSWFNVWFCSNSQIVIYNGAERSVSIYDLQDEKTHHVLDKEYFQQNPHFPNVPYSITYSPEFDMLCCVSCSEYDEETLESREFVTIVDMDGNVLAVSDEIITHSGVQNAEVYFYNNMLFLNMYPNDTSNEVMGDVYTYLYRALYSTDEAGSIVFSEDYV